MVRPHGLPEPGLPDIAPMPPDPMALRPDISRPRLYRDDFNLWRRGLRRSPHHDRLGYDAAREQKSGAQSKQRAAHMLSAHAQILLVTVPILPAARGIEAGCGYVHWIGRKDDETTVDRAARPASVRLCHRSDRSVWIRSSAAPASELWLSGLSASLLWALVLAVAGALTVFSPSHCGRHGLGGLAGRQGDAGAGGDVDTDSLAGADAGRSRAGHPQDDIAQVELNLVVHGVSEIAGAHDGAHEKVSARRARGPGREPGYCGRVQLDVMRPDGDDDRGAGLQVG